VDADVHKDAEVDDISDGALELHPRLQVLQLHHIGAENGGGQLIPGVPSGLHQLPDDVRQGGGARAANLRQPVQSDGLRPGLQLLQPACLHVCLGIAAGGQQLFRRAIALRMDACVVQNRGTLRHPEEAGALLVRLGTQLGHLQQLLPGGEGPVLLPVPHQIPGGRGCKTGHPLEQGGRRGIRIHSNSIDAVLYHAVQRLSQAGLGHIVLILSHADGLGVDLHQLGQGILEPPGDGHGASQVHIVLWKLLGGQLAGGVHRRPRLADDHIAQPAPQAADELHGRLLRLPAGRSIADGDVLHPVLPHQLGQPGNGLLPLPRTVGGVDHRGVQHLSGAVHHRHLTAHAVAGVQSHGHPALHRGLHQQGLQI